MAASVASSAPPAQLQGIHRDRLFVASCCALAVSAVAFAVIGDILGALKSQFILDNQQVGFIGGAAIWRPLAPDSDSLAREGLAFLRSLLAEQSTRVVH